MAVSRRRSRQRQEVPSSAQIERVRTSESKGLSARACPSLHAAFVPSARHRHSRGNGRFQTAGTWADKVLSAARHRGSFSIEQLVRRLRSQPSIKPEQTEDRERLIAEAPDGDQATKSLQTPAEADESAHAGG